MTTCIPVGFAMIIGAATGTAVTILWLGLIWLGAKLAGKWWGS